MRGFGFLAAIACCWPVPEAWAEAGKPSGQLLLDGMAARVGSQVITVREGRFFLGLQRFREGKEPLEDEAGGELRGAVQRLILEQMVHAEMKSLRFDGGPRSEAEKAMAARKKPPRDKVWQKFLKTYGKSDAVAMDRVWRSLQVERFIQRRVETMAPIVTSAEIDRHIRQKQPQAESLGEAQLAQLRPQAAQELKKELMRKELEEWIVLLKRKYQATNYLEK